MQKKWVLKPEAQETSRERLGPPPQPRKLGRWKDMVEESKMIYE